ncbi:RNA polymerase sigma factor [Elizabethkingia sp. JS20170427COW]|uniref:RNA polymerase sigma factor n=1 Tax=Elizabethkingia sp. JS20170427COW TaxID=2583851 RepID=UPI001110BB9D|nr:sigma-70 family RNA polymerase sigma factor [Elizabethkingia sp. JS20170427COW]QCX53143.1 sigma-70 family RNA polymerase sigma factor [Elizabethkingia sp. JS20170427COW]
MKAEESIIIQKMKAPHTREQGLKLLMDTYQTRLYWHIRRLVVNHDDAQDLLQDTFVKVYRNFDNFKEESQLYTWIYRIATNEALQHLNKIKKMQKTDEGVETYLQNAVADNLQHDATQIEVLLQKAIQSLSEKQKLVFNLKYYEDLPYEELSKILDMSVGTLKTNYHYAKEKVTLYIQQHLEE